MARRSKAAAAAVIEEVVEPPKGPILSTTAKNWLITIYEAGGSRLRHIGRAAKAELQNAKYLKNEEILCSVWATYQLTTEDINAAAELACE